MITFQKITCYSNWCYFDYLDGRKLEKGEQIEVRWPDGTIEPYEVQIERGSSGGRDDIPWTTAYVEVLHHGVWMRADLRKDGIEVRRLPKDDAATEAAE